jgi:sulfate adenylyltransferase
MGDRGFTVFFTGLSGSGKSTVANTLLGRLAEAGHRPVELIDGDNVRRQLTPELGFSKEDRDLNIHRIASMAAEITCRGGVAICAAIAPYDAARRRARQMIEAVGGFVLIHMATPLAVCEHRDAKGLYAKARARAISDFTGISGPYETPIDAELAIDASEIEPREAAERILTALLERGYLL